MIKDIFLKDQWFKKLKVCFKTKKILQGWVYMIIRYKWAKLSLMAEVVKVDSQLILIRFVCIYLFDIIARLFLFKCYLNFYDHWIQIDVILVGLSLKHPQNPS